MGDKATQTPVKSCWPGLVEVPVRVVYGASGAITTFQGPGITTVADGGAGITTITLAHGYAGGCIGIKGYSLEGAAATVGLFPRITADASDSTSAAPTVSITLCTEAGTATDPTDTHAYTYWLVFDELGLTSAVTP